jgi:hypothetical protein
MPHWRNKGHSHFRVSRSWPYLTASFIFPNSLRKWTSRRLAWARGKNLALLIGELLQALLQPLAAPFATLSHHFTFYLSQTRKYSLGLIHIGAFHPCFVLSQTVEETATTLPF